MDHIKNSSQLSITLKKEKEKKNNAIYHTNIPLLSYYIDVVLLIHYFIYIYIFNNDGAKGRLAMPYQHSKIIVR
jgi:hypothetical protein